jgi:hypothetical protein
LQVARFLVGRESIVSLNPDASDKTTLPILELERMTEPVAVPV